MKTDMPGCFGFSRLGPVTHRIGRCWQRDFAATAFPTSFSTAGTAFQAPARNRAEARQDVFDYIEMFYNPKRKHINNGMLSPVDFEERQLKLKHAGV